MENKKTLSKNKVNVKTLLWEIDSAFLRGEKRTSHDRFTEI